MKQVLVGMVLCMTLLISLFAQARQSAATAAATAVVPTLVRYGGALNDINGKPLTTITGVTFLLYKDEQGGAPLWMETQNVISG